VLTSKFGVTLHTLQGPVLIDARKHQQSIPGFAVLVIGVLYNIGWQALITVRYGFTGEI